MRAGVKNVGIATIVAGWRRRPGCKHSNTVDSKMARKLSMPLR